ncbi:MAG: thioredoxin [Candidatus Paracaedibacteraceae bacterium]|nr:thioredoxin [Candidatus Paracaedibacteraceae bacterium]
MSVNSISDATFEKEVLESSLPVLIDFWAAWCGPCRMVAPVLDDLAKDMSDKLKIVKINVDENPETPTIYQVRSIPTLILFKKGETVSTMVGAHPKSKLVDWLNEHLV